MSPAASRHQDGAAIIAALLTVALVAGLSVAAFWQQWRGIEVEMADRQRLQAQWLITGALDWARARVGEDGVRSPQLDHGGEAWAQPVRNASLQEFLSGRSSTASTSASTEQGPSLSLQIDDAQAKLNLLNLLEGQAISPVWLAVFQRLFDSLALPPAQLKGLAEQLRMANLGTITTGAGALPGDAKVPLVPTRLSDLTWLGVDATTVQALAPHVSLLPGRLAVNLNTASAPVLQAVLNLPAAQAQQWVAQRQAQPFASLAATGLKNPDAQMLAVSSHFFEVRIELRPDGSAPLLLLEHALLQRDGRDVRTLWQRRALPETATPTAPR